MRFAAAIAILAQGLVSAKEPTSVHLLRNQELTRTHRVAAGRISGSAQSYRSRELRQNTAIDAIKEKIAALRAPRKCDPNEADIGILEQCRPQEYCSDSGVCSPRDVMIRQTGINDTTIDDAFGEVIEDIFEDIFSEFTYYNLLCNASSPIYKYGAPEGATTTCDCTDLDVTDQTGMVNCTIPVVCDGDLCYETKFALGFDGSFSEYEFGYNCLNFTAPYEQEICSYYGYNKNDPSECVIGINGIDCDSCTVEQVPNEFESTSQCVIFDCTNIANGNAGSDCEDDTVTDIFENLPTLFPVDATVSFLESIIFGISRMSVEEQIEWATLTAEYMVQYYDTIAQDILRDLIVVIEVLAVMPRTGDGRRLHELVDTVKVIYNTDLSYRIEDPSLISPEEVAQLPFFSQEDQANYALFMMEFGSGNLANITDIEPLGPRDPIRPDKHGKKGKKSSKKSSKSDKSSKKSSKSAKSERHPIYLPPSMEEINANIDDFTKGSKKSKKSSVSESQWSDPSKKGKKRRH